MLIHRSRGLLTGLLVLFWPIVAPQSSEAQDDTHAIIYWFQPGILIPSRTLPTQTIPRPMFRDLHFNNRHGRYILASLQAKLAILTESSMPPTTSELHVGREFRQTHEYFLLDQLQRNNLDPVLGLGPSFNNRGTVYAYMLEATPEMIQVFGPFNQYKARWCILEVFTLVQGIHDRPALNALKYVETSGPDIIHIRSALAQSLGLYTIRLANALRPGAVP